MRTEPLVVWIFLPARITMWSSLPALSSATKRMSEPDVMSSHTVIGLAVEIVTEPPATMAGVDVPSSASSAMAPVLAIQVLPRVDVPCSVPTAVLRRRSAAPMSLVANSLTRPEVTLLAPSVRALRMLAAPATKAV